MLQFGSVLKGIYTRKSKYKILILIPSSIKLLYIYLTHQHWFLGPKSNDHGCISLNKAVTFWFYLICLLISPVSFTGHSGERLYRYVYSAFRLSFQPSQGPCLAFWHRDLVLLQLSRQYSKFTSTTPGFLICCPIKPLPSTYPVILPSFIVPYSMINLCSHPQLPCCSLLEFSSQAPILTNAIFLPLLHLHLLWLDVTGEEHMATLTGHSLEWSQIWGCPSGWSSKLPGSPRSFSLQHSDFHTFFLILKLPTFPLSCSLSVDPIAFFLW